MMAVTRYAAGTVLGLFMGSCGPDLGSDLSWLEDLDTANSGPVPCFAAVTLPSDLPGEAPREERIKTPCPEEMTPEFVSSLQRALAARDLYEGPVTGVFGPLTTAGVEAYQTARGLPTSVLSLATARELGLIAYPRPEGELPTPPEL